MTYNEARKEIGKHQDVDRLTLMVANAVMWSLDSVEIEADDTQFTNLCNYVRGLWDDAETGYVQLMSDVVVECITHYWGDKECKDITLTWYDVKCLEHYDEVLRAYNERY